MTNNPYIEMARRALNAIPHNADLGITLVDLQRARCLAKLSGNPMLGGDRDGGLYFPSVLLTLADAACGVAFISAVGEYGAVATLDLRIDYLRPVPVSQTLVVDAHCHRYTGEIGFLKCDIRGEGAEEPAALVTATFLRTKRTEKARAA